MPRRKNKCILLNSSRDALFPFFICTHCSACKLSAVPSRSADDSETFSEVLEQSCLAVDARKWPHQRDRRRSPKYTLQRFPPTSWCWEGCCACAEEGCASNCLGSRCPSQPSSARGAAGLRRVVLAGATCFGSAQRQREPYVELQENRCCFSICEIKLLESSQLSAVQERAHPINLQRQRELLGGGLGNI